MTVDTKLSVVVLAAGKGTRMKSKKAKVLHDVFGKPMLHHVLDAVALLSPSQSIVILGHQEETVRRCLDEYNVEIVIQEDQLGTGHAVRVARPAIQSGSGEVMILCGDTPLISPESLKTMRDAHHLSGAVLTMMTTELDDPTGYGRIVTEDGAITAIVEEKEATEKQKAITEINAGIYLVKSEFLFQALETITADNSQGEFYLTDIVAYGVSQGLMVRKVKNSNCMEVLGVNSRVELEEANRVLRDSRNVELMQQGVTIRNRATVSVSPAAEVGRDTVLSEHVIISGKSRIGESCTIESGVKIDDCVIGDDVHVGANAVLRNCRIDSGSAVPPLSLDVGD